MPQIGVDYHEEGFKPLLDKTIQAQLADLFGLIYQGGPAPIVGPDSGTTQTSDLGLPTKQVVKLLRRIYSQTGMNGSDVDSAISQVESWVEHLGGMQGYWNGVLSTLQGLRNGVRAEEDAEFLTTETLVHKPRLHRVLRREFDREEQEKMITRYGNDLGSVFQDWLVTSAKRGMAPTLLVDRLCDLAESYFATAFL